MEPWSDPSNYSPSGNYKRVCRALTQLVAELQDLYPELVVEYDGYDGRGVAREALLDLTEIPEHEREFLRTLLLAHKHDPRISYVRIGLYSPDASIVMHPSARTQDDPTPFELNDTYMSMLTDAVLGEGAGS